MDHREDDIIFQSPSDEPVVYLNQGTLRLVFVVENREQNRELLDSLFTHMGVWFEENAHHLADAPEMDGASWRLHQEIIGTFAPTDLPGAEDISDTFPEEWGS
jgi:hypothetical protein